MPHLHLSSEQLEELAQLERDMKQWVAIATNPKVGDARKITAQLHARRCQARIEVIQELSGYSQLEFAKLEAARQEELGI